MKLSEKIDFFTGVISSGNTPALGPVAEELKVLTIFVDGCTDFLFDKAVPKPHYIFRITNIQSADGVTCGLAAAKTWPERPSASPTSIPTTRTAATPSTTSTRHEEAGAGGPGRLRGLAEARRPPTSPRTSRRPSRPSPDLLVSSVWGGDYVAFYKQALRYDMFKKMKVASTLAFGGGPARHRQGPSGRARSRACHSNYYFNYPPKGRWPLNDQFVKKYLRPVEGVPELPVRGRLLDPLHAEDRDREGQPARGRLAGRRRDHQPARGPDASPGRRATSTSGPTTTRATRTR